MFESHIPKSHLNSWKRTGNCSPLHESFMHIDKREVVKPESHPENLRILQLLCVRFLLCNFLNLGIQCRQSLVKQARIENQMRGHMSFFNHK